MIKLCDVDDTLYLLDQRFSNIWCLFTSYSLDRTRFTYSRDLFANMIAPNQTQAYLFECMAPSTGGVNSFRPCFLSKIFLENVSAAVRAGIFSKGFIRFTPESPPFTPGG